jgi:uncharacterized protein (TIGR01777 family)
MPTVLIGGGTGLIGIHLSHLLKQKGYEVIHLSRKGDLKAFFPRYAWNPETGEIEKEAILKADYVINLAGAGIADKRWTKSRKRTIIESRVKSMHLLKTAFEKAGKTPRAFIAASATGFYGSRGDELLDENSDPGNGFLSESTQEWEKSTEALEQKDTRLVTIRIGIVLSSRGGALPKLVLPQKFWIGTYFSDGKDYYPWIHIDDLCNIFIKSIEDENMTGTFNGVAPNPMTNIQITKAIAQAKNKRVLMFPVPAFLLRLGMGEMADVILTSARVSAQKLQSNGFEFKYPEIIPALKDLFERKI